MPHLNSKGPENGGPLTGRGLGNCANKNNKEEALSKLGKGMGLKYHSGGGKGMGKRLKYNQIKKIKNENSSSGNTEK